MPFMVTDHVHKSKIIWFSGTFKLTIENREIGIILQINSKMELVLPFMVPDCLFKF